MNFFKRYPLTANILAMFIVGIMLVFLAMWGLDVWTAHGQVQVVPDVRTLTVSEARQTLGGCNLQVEVVDSVYGSHGARGSVVEQVPPPGNRVKPGRTVYLTINAFEAKKVTLPELIGSSVRQARATLQSLGFTDIREVRVPSDYRDLVIAVKSMGVPMRAGTVVPVGSSIIIEVGEGYDPYRALDNTIEAIDSAEWDDENNDDNDLYD
ncbi:MAG: PASTA domain-containing protein [Muribaculaceae bacterium]|nr:PASTA domain-containing protein [Muribaculaceae bacterium]